MPKRVGLNPDPSYSEQLAKYYTEADLNAIPQHVLDHTKQVIIDFLGCVIGGADVDTTKQIKKVFMDRLGECTVFNGGKAPVERAAFINGSASHALEMDDAHYDAGGHAAVVIIPAALAMAEHENATGLEFMQSIVWGYDMMTRVGKGVVPDHCFDRGWHPTATNGIFGATAAASFLMKLNAQQWANAWGIAYGFASGNLECYEDATMTKRLNPANAAQSAVNAARLAATGYTGPRWCFEGKHGYFTAYTDDPTPERMLEKMDYSEYGVVGAAFKPYACCRYNHAPIDSIIKAMKDNNIKAEDIEKIVIDTCQMAIRAVVEPRELKYNPDNVAGAQFSLPYTTTCAALYGNASVKQFTEEAIRRPAVREFIHKIEMVHTGDMDVYLPDKFAATAEIFTKDGKSYKALTTDPKGDVLNPMTVEEIKAKYMDLATMSISEDRAKEIYDTVMRLETLTDIHELTRLF
jgi:2-methylcitrate dehydratase PrpD